MTRPIEVINKELVLKRHELNQLKKNNGSWSEILKVMAEEETLYDEMMLGKHQYISEGTAAGKVDWRGKRLTDVKL